MATARDIMTAKVDFVDAQTSLTDAAKKMATGNVGALPVCGDGRVVGMITDRDIVVKALAEGLDPSSMTVGELTDHPAVVTIGAEDAVEAAIKAMKEHGVRRLPVIDGDELVGMISQADIARAMPDSKVGDLVGVISAAPPNN